MTITWRHMGLTLFIALALHGGIALWLTLPAPQPLPPPPKPPLRISLLATVAETTITPAVTPPPQPVAKPPPPQKVIPEPAPKPVPIPEPVIEKSTPKPEPVAEPTPKPIAEAVPVESTPVPLSAAATAKYEQLLVAWLEQHKRYPKRAKRMRIEGEGMLRIRIDRTGRMQDVILEQRTGNRLLDKAALAMAQRADPFPSMPENDPRRELEFRVPVVFALR